MSKCSTDHSEHCCLPDPVRVECESCVSTKATLDKKKLDMATAYRKKDCPRANYHQLQICVVDCCCNPNFGHMPENGRTRAVYEHITITPRA